MSNKPFFLSPFLFTTLYSPITNRFMIESIEEDAYAAGGETLN